MFWCLNIVKNNTLPFFSYFRSHKMKSERYTYKIFNLHLHSAMPLPELSLADTPEQADIHIVFGPVPDMLENCTVRGVCFQAVPKKILFTYKRIGKFLITNGNTITIDSAPGADEREIKSFILGTCMGNLLSQRGLFVLHGNVVVTNDKAIVICGSSGAGKSSLAAAFCRRGFALLADDVAAISWHNDIPFVLPAFPYIKLWEDTAKMLGMEPDPQQNVWPGLKKYRFRYDNNFYDKACIPTKIIILSTKNTPDIRIDQLQGMNKFTMLKNNTYRLRVLDGLGLKEQHFMHCAKLAAQTEVYHVARPIHIDVNILAEHSRKIFG